MRARLIAIMVPLVVLALGTVGTAVAAAPGAQMERVIVVLDDGADVDAAAAAAQANHGAEVSATYRTALQGFAASVPSNRVAALARDARVRYVEHDTIQSIQVQTTPTGVQRIFADMTALAIDGSDDQRVDVDVAIIDTGIDREHPDLNVVDGVHCAYDTSGRGPAWKQPLRCNGNGDDDHFHGTHVAGTVGALDNGIGVVGVAPGARLWAVKVLSSEGRGYTSEIIAGIDWVAARADQIEVANMSLGGSGFSQAEYDAIQGAVDAGVAFAVAAGNDKADARNYSPGGFDNVLSVSALADFDGAPGGTSAPTCRSDEDDTLANFSNWGPAIDVAAPGVCILSTYPLDHENGPYHAIDGTSMASPHVAGALALLASTDNPGTAADVVALYDTIRGTGNHDWTDDSGDGIHEPLLDISSAAFVPALAPNDGGTVDPPPPPPPSTEVTLTAQAGKDKGVHVVTLLWDGAGTTTVQVIRDGEVVATPANNGSYEDRTGNKGGRVYTYQVCETGDGGSCSNEVTVIY